MAGTVPRADPGAGLRAPAALAVAACLGSGAFRRAREDALRRLAAALPEDLDLILERLHLSGVACVMLTHAPRRRSAGHRRLRAYFTYQALLARLIREELLRIAGPARRRGITVSLLKGPALWDTAYVGEDAAVRRMHDADVLVNRLEQLGEYVGVLQAAGYRCLVDGHERFLDDEGQYELPPFCRSIGCRLTRAEADAVRVVNDSTAFSSKVRLVGASAAEFDFEIEPHKAPFLYVDGSRPVLGDALFTESRSIPGYRVPTPALLLPYLSAKFILDAERALRIADGTAKCMKLAVDLSRLIGRLTPADLAGSIEVAHALNLAGHYHRAVSLLRPYHPDIAFTGLGEPRTDDLLGDLTRMVVERAEQGGPVFESSTDVPADG